MKRNSLKIACLATAVMLANGCAKKLVEPETNRAPVLVKTVTDVMVKQNGSILISLRHVDGYDDDGDPMSVVLSKGTNYTLSGNIVTPDAGFIGDLAVPVRLYDGKTYSEQKNLIVSVVTNEELFPLIEGSWWEYRDSVVANDSTYATRMSAVFANDSLIGETAIRIFDLKWENLAEYGVVYKAYTDSTGMVLMGGVSPTHSLIEPQLLYRYPVKKGDSWKAYSLNYNATDNLFYKGETATLTCTDTLQYVTVPAGIFECVEMTMSYSATRSRSGAANGFSYYGTEIVPGSQSRAVDAIVEKLYYSKAVGYVKNVTTVNGQVAWIKELTDYAITEAK